MLDRPERFDDFIGHSTKVEFFREHILSGTLPNFIIMSGPSGVGKTTLAKLIALMLNCTGDIRPCYTCESCQTIAEEVIRKNKDTSTVVSRKMTTDGSKDKTKEIVELFQANFLTEKQNKVIILDEAHRMSAEAQDAILIDTEYLAKNVYVFMLTTDVVNMREAVMSRAVHIQLSTLSKADMIRTLKKEANRRGLAIEQSDLAYNLIATWAENKPRKGLKVLEAMGENKSVALETIKDFVTYIDTTQLIPIVSSLATESFLVGVNAIDKLTYDTNTQQYLVDFLIEVLRLKRGAKTTSLTSQDAILLRDSIKNIDIELLALFLSGIASYREIDRNRMLAIYLSIHPVLSKLNKRDLAHKAEESRIKQTHGGDESFPGLEFKNYQNLEQLKRGGTILSAEGEVSEAPPSLASLVGKAHSDKSE